MLYVFQVDTGQMLNFEMDVAISTVHTLKSKILSIQGIPLDKQVLLVSGGEILEINSRVCNYAAGTDTNPIFLFNKLTIESGGPDQSSFLHNHEHNSGSSSIAGNVNVIDLDTILKQIQDSSTLPTNYPSVVSRAQLAQQLYEMGKEITRRCEVLIHHQHLQHQGWAAVVANLDDIVGVFSSKMQTFVSAYESFFAEFQKEFIDSLVDGLDDTIQKLDTIRLPTPSKPPITPDDPTSPQPQTIVQWLSEHFPSTSRSSPSHTLPDNPRSPLHSHLHSLSLSTRKTYEHLTSPNFLSTLQQESGNVTEKASAANMKEIKGLEERLYGLDQLLQEAKKIVLDQQELTQAFHQNVARASDVRDSSIFPDLCASHQHQLVVMGRNQSQLEDIRRRCGRAKEELTGNLNTRLKWIAFVQKSLSEMGGKIGVYYESLRRLRVNVNVLRQVGECEHVFGEYVEEARVRGVVGRKLRRLVRRIIEFNNLVEGENKRRGGWRKEYAGHFLSQADAFKVLVAGKENGDWEIGVVKVPEIGGEWESDEVKVKIEYESEQEDQDEGDDEEWDEEDYKQLSVKVKELEASIEAFRSSQDVLEERLRGVEGELEKERLKSRRLERNLVDCRLKGRVETERADKLGVQVGELKKLIDEFRVKEDEVIRMHGEEVEAYERRIREVEGACEGRVVELRKVLEFEWGQKIKELEESHKLEYDAMVKRFKMVNKSGALGGSSERISSGSSAGVMLSPVTGGKRFGSGLFGGMMMMGEEEEGRNKKKGRRGIRSLFSDEEDEEDEMMGGDEEEDYGFEEDERKYRGIMVGGREERSGSIIIGAGSIGGFGGEKNMRIKVEGEEGIKLEEYCDEDERRGSLESAVDATVAFFGEEEEVGREGGGGRRESCAGEIEVPERVVTTATRLHKLSRISISTCRVGSESNLFYWNEMFNAFTVYLNNKNVHFLNTSERSNQQQQASGVAACSEGADAQQNALIKSLSKSKMFIAIVTDKEFCVARRAQNRYNVPQGFHFYRVKCKVTEVLDESAS